MYPKGLFIDNELIEDKQLETIESIDPSEGEIFSEVYCANENYVNQAVESSKKALETTWVNYSALDRSRLLKEFSHEVLVQIEALAHIEMLDTGKPLDFARNIVKSVSRYFEYYAGVADKIQGETIPLSKNYIDFTLKEPLGVSAQIIPWNVPISMMARGIAPALAAGCTTVIKPAELTPIGALQLAQIAKKVGFPAGVINVINGKGATTGKFLSSHPKIDGITFTGSVNTGIDIMQSAAKNIKPVTLELGGKSPIIACNDCDIDSLVESVCIGIYSNSGQFCDASSILLVHKNIKQQVIEKLIEKTKTYTVGKGKDNKKMGPLISQGQLDRVLNYIKIAQEQGAKLQYGGRTIPDLGKGYFVEPTIFSEVTSDMRIAQEEIFGPVLSIIDFDDIEQAIAIANGTEYGLATGIFSTNINTALHIAKSVKAGSIYVNEYYCGDVSMPFGGFKKSGIGRENGLETIGNYTQTKNIILSLKN